MPERTKQQEMASKILAAVTAKNFDMGIWIDLPYYNYPDQPDCTLAPDVEPPCGTTMCAAGWAARLDGYTLNYYNMTATREGTDPIHIGSAGALALGITKEVTERRPLLFLAENDVALRILRRMADGEPYSDRMVEEEDGCDCGEIDDHPDY